LTATAGNARVTLSWTPVLGAARYTVKRGLSPTTLSTIASPATATLVDSGVVNLTTYYYAVSALNAQSAVESGDSAPVSATPAVLPAPANLLALAGNAQVALSWSAVAGASSYRLVRSGTIVNVGAVTAYTDAPLANGVAYSYYVYASPAAGGEGAHSNTVTATPVGPPAAPASLSAVASGTTVSLVWAGSAGATRYDVLRSSTSGGGFVVVAAGVPTTTWPNAGLATGTTYYYVVRAANEYGSGPVSPQAQATTVPSAPTGLVATGGAGQITLSWAATAKATTYNVLRSSTGGSGYVASTGSTGLTSTGFVDSGLAAGATYYYVVEAVNAAGTSARSGQAQTITAPAAPGGLAWSSPSTTQVTVSWGAVAGATTYKLKRASASGGPYTTAATGFTSPAYTDGALAPGTTYWYVASAANAAGESPNSAQIVALTRPAAPTLGSPTVGYRMLGLSWNAVTSATNYNVKRATTAGGPYAQIATVSTTSYSNTGLTNGTVYYYVIAAVNSAGEGPNSAQVSGTPVTRPPVDDGGGDTCSCSAGYSCKCGDGRCYSSTQSCP
jgi:fibronectin type 3 domain-containing protein